MISTIQPIDMKVVGETAMNPISGFVSSDNNSNNANWFDGLDNALTGNLDYTRQKALLDVSNAFNEKQASIERKFQRDMRDTAYQATVQDLKKAGLNPYLAYNNGASGLPTTNATRSSAVSSAKYGQGWQSLFGLMSALLSGVVGGSFGLAKQSLKDNNTLNRDSVQNAFKMAKQANKKDLNVEQFMEIYDFLQSKKNGFVERQNDRKYTKSQLDDLFKSLQDDQF